MTQSKIVRKSVFGILSTHTELEHAISELKARGFNRDDISVVMPKGDYAQDMTVKNETKAPEGASIGATSGLVLGGTFGWLVGAGLLAISGLGPLVAAGPLLAALAGASVVGTLGGIGGALVGMGIPEYEAQRYESALKNGGTLISIHTDGEIQEEKAKSILKSFGAKDISSSRDKDSDHRPRTMVSESVTQTTYPL